MGLACKAAPFLFFSNLFYGGCTRRVSLWHAALLLCMFCKYSNVFFDKQGKRINLFRLGNAGEDEVSFS